jgi:hypothetical protein
MPTETDIPADTERKLMSATLTIRDETASGQKTNTFTLDCLTERMTVRDLIRARIYQEVQDYNQKEPEYFRGLVEPTNAERVLNGYKLKAKRKIEWREQYQRALEAFDRNGFFVLVGDKQAESLDQEFEVKVDTEVAFVKLVPLVGG